MQYSDSFQLALDFVNYTNVNIFLTGKAGTGKTTFLKHCKESGIKNTAVVAPTGVAAMNAGGTTIHSFFQLPFTPYVPGSKGFNNSDDINDKNSLISRLKLTGERREVMQKLELLIIDEISMVRCDVLDAIDIVLRHVRNQYSKPFGGVQVLLIGDMYQLPPVVKDEEWQILSPYYKSQYFFNSQVMETQPPIYVALDKIYRQNDPAFVNVLNQVRNNEMDSEGYELLHSRYLPDFNPKKEENYITLTTHNNKADTINFKELNELKGKSELFDALIEGEFYEKSFPADMQLKLKVGAQVMFIKNDTEKIRRYFNGKIGVVKKIDDDKIEVFCSEENISIEVKKEKWKNVRYIVDKATNKVEESEIGSFTQFPLRLAWAITIHKSQGLTFEKAIIDAGSAFAPGQVYVALSRCTNLQGMILHSRIQNHSLHSDSRIVDFASTQKTSATQLQILENAKKDFQTEEIKNLFDFSVLQVNAKALLDFVVTEEKTFNSTTVPSAEIINTAIINVNNIALKFEPQLLQLAEQQGLPENNEALQKRIIAASNHFFTEIEKIKREIDKNSSETDSKTIAMDFNKLLLLLYNNICLKLHLLNGNKNGFSISNYLQCKRSFTKPYLSVNAYSGKSTSIKTDSANPELYKMLRKKRDEICDEKNTPVYLIAGSATLEEMALYLPQTINELNQISGFGPVKSRQYGDVFLNIIRDYCEEYNLQSNLEMKVKKAAKPKTKKAATAKKEIKPDTKTVSFNLFKEGKTIEEIAFERNINATTVEGHLAYFIELDELDISNLLSTNKINPIKLAIEKFGRESTKTIKENLPDNISYGEIRMVLASIK